ncbi:MAG: hypothetical protein EXR72_15710 [Myxococcales bacterium]|nr:hypothetical protein [Myxococcales bacterium]
MRLRLQLLALGCLGAAPSSAVVEDLDGDQRPEQIAVDEAGALVVTGGDGRRWGEVPPPGGAVRLAREAATMKVVRVRGAVYVHARAPVRGAPAAVETVALVEGTTTGTEGATADRLPLPLAGGGRGEGSALLRAVYSGVTGPVGRDGERAERLRVDGEGVLRYQTAAGVDRCDGFDLLFPELYDPSAARFRRVSIAPPEGPPLRALAVVPPAFADAPLGLFRFVAASTVRGDGGRADRLAPPREIEDGRADTAWVEGLPGFGEGAFVTARSRVAGRQVVGVKLTRPEGRRWNRLTEVALIVGTESFRVALPEGRVLYIPLPAPVAADCVTLALAGAQPADRGDTAIAEAAIYTDRDGPDGLSRLAAEITAGVPGSDSLVALLAARGPPGLLAVRAALPGTTGDARRRLLRVAIAAGSPEAAALLVGSLGTADEDERRLLASALAPGAALGPMAERPLLDLLADRAQSSGARADAVVLLGRLVHGPALKELFERATAGSGSEDTPVREALVALAETASPGDLLPVVAAIAVGGGEHPEDSLRMVGILGGRARAAGLADVAALAAETVLRSWIPAGDFARRFLLLRAAGKIGAPRLAPIVEAACSDGDEVIRWAAVEAAAGIDGEPGSQLLGVALGDGDPRVRTAALAGLAARKHPGFVAAAAGVLGGDPWPMVRRTAAEYLASGCVGAAPALERAVAGEGERSLEVRRAALYALARCDATRAAPLLLRLTTDGTTPRELREQAAVLLAAGRGPGAVIAIASALDEVLADPRADDRAAHLASSLARALGRLADARGEGALQRAAKASEPLIRAAAVEALADLPTATAAATVAAAKSDPDPGVRRAADRARRPTR